LAAVVYSTLTTSESSSLDVTLLWLIKIHRRENLVTLERCWTEI